MLKTITILSLLLIAGCASTTKSYDNAIDFSIENDGTKGPRDYWLLTKNIIPSIPIDVIKNGGYACAKVSFIISETGRATNINILKSYPKRAFPAALKKSSNGSRSSATSKNSYLTHDGITATFAKSVKKALKGSRWTATSTNLDLTPIKSMRTYDGGAVGVKSKSLCL